MSIAYVERGALEEELRVVSSLLQKQRGNDNNKWYLWWYYVMRAVRLFERRGHGTSF